MHKILLATNIKEKSLNKSLWMETVDLLTPTDLGLCLRLRRCLTYAENATKKPRRLRSQRVHRAGDDSGLEVDALNGQPGCIRTASAPCQAPPMPTVALFARKTPGTRRPWTAHFHATVAVVCRL